MIQSFYILMVITFLLMCFGGENLAYAKSTRREGHSAHASSVVSAPHGNTGHDNVISVQDSIQSGLNTDED